MQTTFDQFLGCLWPLGCEFLRLQVAVEKDIGRPNSANDGWEAQSAAANGHEGCIHGASGVS